MFLGRKYFLFFLALLGKFTFLLALTVPIDTLVLVRYESLDFKQLQQRRTPSNQVAQIKAIVLVLTCCPKCGNLK